MGNMISLCCKNSSLHGKLFGKKKDKSKITPLIITPLYYQNQISIPLIQDISGQQYTQFNRRHIHSPLSYSHLREELNNV
jgi:hypothetical protein